MARLSRVSREQVPEDQRRFHDAVRTIRRYHITGPFIAATNGSPDLAARVAHLGGYFHDRDQADISVLSSRVRSWAAIIGARALDGVYEWAAWRARATGAGISEASADALAAGRRPDDMSDEDALVYDVVMELVGEGHRLSEATYQAALAHFGEQGVVELVANLAYFAMIAFPLNAFEIDLNSADAPILPIAPTTA